MWRSATGNVTALVLCHCESVDSGLLNTSVESFDLHFAVNARATWLLIKEYGLRFGWSAWAGHANAARIKRVRMTKILSARRLPQGPSTVTASSGTVSHVTSR
ncbi:hypothetical protein ACWY4P_13025 [Streptomyces sp. LZ34]